MIGCAFSCAAACLVRNNCLILLIALVLVLLVTALGERKWKLLLSVLLLAVVYLGAKNAVQTMYEQRSGVELNAGAPKTLITRPLRLWRFRILRIQRRSSCIIPGTRCGFMRKNLQASGMIPLMNALP